MLTLLLVYAVLLLLWSMRSSRAPETDDEPGDEAIAERSREAALTRAEGSVRVSRRSAALSG